MFAKCGGPIWRVDDFSTCFQQDFLRVLFPLIACGASLLVLSIQTIRRTVKLKQHHHYTPLDNSKPYLSGAGQSLVADSEIGVSSDINGDDEDLDLVLQKCAIQTHEVAVEVSRPRGELVVIVVEILVLLGEIGVNLAALLTQAWGKNGGIAAIAGLSTWSYIATLACSRLMLARIERSPLPKLWNHTAVLYCVNWVFTVFLFRSTIIHPPSSRAKALMIASFVLTSLLALIALTTRRGNRTVILKHEDNLEPSKEPLASLISLATFSWVDAIVWQGYKKPFEIGDVWNLIAKDRATNVLADFRQLKKTSRLAWHMLRYFKRDLLVQATWAMLAGVLTFAPTMLLKLILEYVEDPQRVPVTAAWLYLILLVLLGCIQAIAAGQALWIGRKICIRLRAIVIGEIYAKTLRRRAAAGSDTVLGQKGSKNSDSDSASKPGLKAKILSFGRKKNVEALTKVASQEQKADSQVNAGTIINLMAVDAAKVSEVSAYLHFLFPTAPVQFAVAVVLLYHILGYSSIASVVILLLLLPVNILVARKFSTFQQKIMAATDARIHSTNEVLQNIRIIKYFAWEHRFGSIINDKREVELRALRNTFILRIGATMIWYGVPLLITAISFFFYTVVEKKDLVPSIAFTTLSLFSLLRYPLDQIADMLARVQECKVSINRVEEFLNEDETEKFSQLSQTPKYENGEMVIGLDHATLTWGGRAVRDQDKAEAFRMINIEVRFRAGHLNIIAGPTGSGKTSLLMALLGEMTLLEGKVHLLGGYNREDLRPDPETGLTESVAYCAQQAWLINDTIKQNIVFASPWDEKRYDSVIKACALERDLTVLEAGDSTLVGEKGIVVSGGQKQRISLARALYCNARHILLDDCLSAVDSHTAQHIFLYAIKGPLLLNRTCILVTHNVPLCVPRSQHVVVLENGKVKAQGPPDVIVASGALGDDLSQPTSKSGTGAPSRTQSTVDLDAQRGGANGHATKTNGVIDEPTPQTKPKEEDESANARTEGKSEGRVKWSVIKMYLSAMGPWYFWILILFAFVCEQTTSVAPNLWIRRWANSYHRKKLDTILVSQNTTPKTELFTTLSTLTSYSWHGVRLLGYSPTANYSSENTLTTNNTSSGIHTTYYLGIYVALGLLYICVCITRFGIALKGSLTASRTIHARLVEAVTRARFKFFDTTPLGQITNRFSKDLQDIDGDLALFACGVVHSLLGVITIITLVSIITPAFLLAGALLGFVYFCVGMFYIKSSRDLKRLESVQRSPLYQQFGETLSGITTIRAYGDERRFIRDNAARVNTYNRPFIYLWATNRWLALRVDFAGSLVSFFAGAFIVLSVGKIDPGAAGLSLTYATMFNENILWLVRLYSINEQNMNSVERIKEYLDVEQEAKARIPENKPAGNWPSRGAVQFLNYTTRYRPDLAPVLKDLNFNIEPEEKVGIVGRTGAGKSSLALALFRGLEADSGMILIDDVNIGLIGLQDLRESLCIVSQDPTLFTGDIRSNLDPFGLFTDEELYAALRSVHLIGTPLSTPSSPPSSGNQEAVMLTPPKSPSSTFEDSDPKHGLKKVDTNTRENANIFYNLSSPISESGSNLSQGQRQLLCLARALLKSPRVLIMDEATASIDYATDAKIQETLREIKGSTIITIAHRLETIIDYDKVLVLDKGEVVEFDAPWELIKRDGGMFRSMCEMSGDFEGLQNGAKKAERKGKLVDLD